MRSAPCGHEDGNAGTGSALLAEFGAHLRVHIGLDRGIENSGRLPSGQRWHSWRGSDAVDALIDTGASISAIDNELALVLDLPIIDVLDVTGMHGPQKSPIHQANFYLPELEFVAVGPCVAAPVTASGFPFRAIFGRDFLRYFQMHYDGTTGRVIIGDPSSGDGEQLV